MSEYIDKSKLYGKLDTVKKTCPFCGFYGTVKFDKDGTKDSMGRKWAYTVSCDRCCASTGVCWNREMAIEAWNRRSSEEQINGIISDETMTIYKIIQKLNRNDETDI